MLTKNLKLKTKNLSGGFGIVEIIVGAAILSVALGGLVAAMRIAVRASYDNLGKTQANFLLTEGVEAVRALRDASWSANIAGLADSSIYYLYFNGTKWATTSAEQVIDGAFYRKFSVYNVYRDGSDNIAASGAADSGTRKAVVSVAWRAGKSTTTVQATTYITNLFSN
jgi:hypothetical protein